MKCRQPTFGRYDDPPQPDAVGGFRRTVRVVPGQGRRRGRTPAVACCRPDGPWTRSCSTARPRTGGTPGHTSKRHSDKNDHDISPLPGDLPGRILVLYHLSGTLAEEAARTPHDSQHREATARVARIRRPKPMRGCSETGRQDRTEGLHETAPPPVPSLKGGLYVLSE